MFWRLLPKMHSVSRPDPEYDQLFRTNCTVLAPLLEQGGEILDRVRPKIQALLSPLVWSPEEIFVSGSALLKILEEEMQQRMVHDVQWSPNDVDIYSTGITVLAGFKVKLMQSESGSLWKNGNVSLSNIYCAYIETKGKKYNLVSFRRNELTAGVPRREILSYDLPLVRSLAIVKGKFVLLFMTLESKKCIEQRTIFPTEESFMACVDRYKVFPPLFERLKYRIQKYVGRGYNICPGLVMHALVSEVSYEPSPTKCIDVYVEHITQASVMSLYSEEEKHGNSQYADDESCDQPLDLISHHNPCFLIPDALTTAMWYVSCGPEKKSVNFKVRDGVRYLTRGYVTWWVAISKEVMGYLKRVVTQWAVVEKKEHPYWASYSEVSEWPDWIFINVPWLGSKEKEEGLPNEAIHQADAVAGNYKELHNVTFQIKFGHQCLSRIMMLDFESSS